jgi:hypothetical protein
MTTGIEYLKEAPKRKGRGPGKKPALMCTSIRLPRHVMEYFNQAHNKQEKIREVLVAYVEQQIDQPNQGE